MGNPRKGSAYERVRADVISKATHCCICGEPLDKTLRYPHPMSPSLEHKDPLSQGFPLIPSRDRLGAAHLKCNKDRGDGTNRPFGKPKTSRRW